MKTEAEIVDFKKEVDAAKIKMSELTGQKNGYLIQLKQEWSFKSTPEGDKKITALLAKLKGIDEEIAAKTLELETKYGL